jgi:hypothetical protein
LEFLGLGGGRDRDVLPGGLHEVRSCAPATTGHGLAATTTAEVATTTAAALFVLAALAGFVAAMPTNPAFPLLPVGPAPELTDPAFAAFGAGARLTRIPTAAGLWARACWPSAAAEKATASSASASGNEQPRVGREPACGRGGANV